MKRLILALALLLAVTTAAPAVTSVHAAPAAAPAAATSHSHAAFFDKTRFLVHMGVGFYAFHHWVLAPFAAGDFASGKKGRVAAMVKAAVALLFAYHEFKVAYGIAEKSNSKTLHALVAPLNGLSSAANSVATKLKNGNYSPSEITSLSSQFGSFATKAASTGYGIKDIATKIPGL